jgi:transcriptional regulator with XRE-family HTH domain
MEDPMWKNKEKAIAQAVGKAIAKKRMGKGLTQENVAEKLNIGYEAVSRIERGIVTPNIARLVELAEIFDCEINELLMNATLRPADHARHLQQLFEPLSEQDRMFLMNIVTGLAERLRKDGGKN